MATEPATSKPSKSSKAAMDRQHTLILDNGIRYKGPVKAQVPHGRGKMVWPNGDEYDGNFVNGKRDGHGKRVNADGSMYEGEYKEDQP